MVIGNWWLTAPDPSGHGELDYGLSRKFVRIGTVCGAWQFVLVLASDPRGRAASGIRANGSRRCTRNDFCLDCGVFRSA